MSSPMDEVAADLVRWETERLWGEGSATVQAPDPRATYGLPDGWVIRDYCEGLMQEGVDFVLVQRPEGDWMLVRHDRTLQATSVVQRGGTIAELFEAVCANVPRPLAVAVPDWMRAAIVAMFDPTDPVEAAEQTLFALGGPLRVVPRSAR